MAISGRCLYFMGGLPNNWDVFLLSFFVILTDHLITGKPLRSEPAQEKWFVKSSIYMVPFFLLGWLHLKAHFGCHGIMLGRSPIKWRQRPDMAIAVEWGVKHQFKQTDNKLLSFINRHIFRVRGL